MSGGIRFRNGDVGTIIFVLLIVIFLAGAAVSYLSATWKREDVEVRITEEKRRSDVLLRERNEALRHCRDEGNVPLFGFNYDVVCVQSDAVLWEYNNEPAE